MQKKKCREKSGNFPQGIENRSGNEKGNLSLSIILYLNCFICCKEWYPACDKYFFKNRNK